MTDVRAIFLATARVAADVLRRPEVGERWESPSALEEFTVRGLAGHLLRATGSTAAYLDRAEPVDGNAIDPVTYYRLAVGDAVDVSSPLHVAIRRRGEDEAAGGWEALVSAADHLVRDMEQRLAAERPDRRVQVYQGLVLLLDDYLVTRLMELVVHIDDLCVSIDVPTPDLPSEAVDLAVTALVGVARRKHGDVAVVRALTRRERADPSTLHVL